MTYVQYTTAFEGFPDFIEGPRKILVLKFKILKILNICFLTVSQILTLRETM